MSDVSDNPVSAWIADARALGQEHGSNAAGWWIQENLTKAKDAQYNASATLAADDNCIESNVPHADLSGQWADSPTPKSILTEILGEEPMGGADEALEQRLVDVYEEAFNDAARDECLSACRNELAS